MVSMFDCVSGLSVAKGANAQWRRAQTACKNQRAPPGGWQAGLHGCSTGHWWVSLCSLWFWQLVLMVWSTFRLIRAKNHPRICAKLCKVNQSYQSMPDWESACHFYMRFASNIIKRFVHSNVFNKKKVLVYSKILWNLSLSVVFAQWRG